MPVRRTSQPIEHPQIERMFACLGPGAIRPMVGRIGIFRRDRIVAVAVRGDILLKADAITAPPFGAARTARWSPVRPTTRPGARRRHP